MLCSFFFKNVFLFHLKLEPTWMNFGELSGTIYSGSMEIPLIEHTLSSLLELFTVWFICSFVELCKLHKFLKVFAWKKTICPVDFKRLLASKVEVQWRFRKQLFCKCQEHAKKITFVILCSKKWLGRRWFFEIFLKYFEQLFYSTPVTSSFHFS